MRWPFTKTEERSDLPTLSMDDWASMFNFNGIGYQNFNVMGTQTLGGNKEMDVAPSFEGYATAAYRSNGVVYACMATRMMLFAQARFQFRQMRGGKPGDLFGTQELSVLERPWQNGTTGDLLARAIQDVDICGNFYCVRAKKELRRLPPQSVLIVMGSDSDPENPRFAWDAKVIGYIYRPLNTDQVKTFLPEEVCHFAPTPDPLARFRGMSWLTPVLREIVADNAMTTHQRKYFEQGATGNMVVPLDPEMSDTAFERFVRAFKDQQEGVANAYKTIFLKAAAQPVVVGNNLSDFKIVKGHGETRIAAAAGVPPIIVGLSEGLEASTYSNYAQARRRFADGTMHYLWKNMASSFATLVTAPQDFGGSELWYDTSGIAFLREDEKDASEIQATQSSAMRQLIDAGFEPKTVVDAIVAGDLSRLVHTGLFSVQLQPPGTTLTPGAPILPAPKAIPPTVIGKQKQKQLKAASARALLEPFIIEESA
jgi:phage portal protein BeeE